MKKPLWQFAPLSKRDVIKARLEREKNELGIAYNFEVYRETNKVGGQLVTTGEVKWRQLPTPAECRPPCGAKTQTGQPCRRKVAIKANGDWGKRCSKHGGLSTGPKTPAGRARQSAAVSQANAARRDTRYRVATPADEIKTIADVLTLTPAPRRQWIDGEKEKRAQFAAIKAANPALSDAFITTLVYAPPEKNEEVKSAAEAELERRAQAARDVAQLG